MEQYEQFADHVMSCIADEAAIYFKIDRDELRRNDPTPAIEFPRTIAMYLCNHILGHDDFAVARYFLTSHVSVCHAFYKVEELIEDDIDTRLTVNELLARLEEIFAPDRIEMLRAKLKKAKTIESLIATAEIGFEKKLDLSLGEYPENELRDLDRSSIEYIANNAVYSTMRYCAAKVLSEIDKG
jgi:hypothetical protein